jgi:glycosyltransferase involved in cell wall biosynthesis
MAVRKLRVLTLVDKPTVTGGAERLAAVVAMKLDPARFESVLCASRQTDERLLDRELEEAGIGVLALGRRSTLDLLAWRPLVSLLRDGVDVVHTHMFGSNVWGTVLGRLSGVPVVIAHEHTWSFQGRPLRRFLDRELVARWADVFVAVSGEDRRKMIEVEGVDPAKIRLIPNGIASPANGAVADVRAELDIEPRVPVLGVVCELRAQKALEVLFEAAALLLAEFPTLKVLVAGDGPERARLEEGARRLGVEDTVLFLGIRRDVPAVLAAVDVAVLSSDYEGSPLSVMEYMAAAKPVVSTRVGGVPELVKEDVHGLLVQPRDPKALAEAVARLLRDPALAKRLGAEGRKRQQREFSLEAMVRRIEDLYEELWLASGRRGER